MKTNVIPFVYKDDLFFRAEYNEDAKVFEVLGPSKPHPNGGTSREVVQIFMDEDCEADALSLARILNKQCLPLMREVASLTAEVAQLREELKLSKSYGDEIRRQFARKQIEFDQLRAQYDAASEEATDRLLPLEQELAQVIEALTTALKKAQNLLTMTCTEVQRVEIQRFLGGGFQQQVEAACFNDSLGIDAALSRSAKPTEE